MQNFGRFVHELREYWRIMLIAIVLTLINASLSLPFPLIVQYLTDHLSDDALRQNHPVNIAGVFWLVVGIAALSAFCGYWLSLCLTYLGQNFKLQMRRKLYAHMQTLSLGFFEKAQTGKLMSNITNDVAALDQLVSGSLITIIQDTVTLLAVMGFIFYQNWRLALIALAVYPIYILNYLAFIGKIKFTHHEMREQRDMMYGDLQEKLSGVQVVKSYAKERFEVRQFIGETRGIMDLNVRIGAMSTGLWTIAELIGAVGTAMLLWYGGRQVMQGAMTAGALMAFYGFISGYLYGPTLRLIQINDQIARANAALWRIFKTLDTQPNVTDKPDARPLPEIQGNVLYDNVWFEYEPGQPVIKGVRLDVKAGEMVIFVGPSGSGKTTMVNLLQRHYDVTGGSIAIDGHDLREIQLRSLRQQVGVVIQETILFNATIGDNIRYGKLDATEAEVIEAAKAANIHHVIEALPLRYETKLGEDGTKLSGGEKQRIAIARALLANPRVLILDEATSSLDSETEALIQEALDHLMAGRTSFVIAHRLSTIVKADKIVVMEKGVIREAGSHAELLEKDGIYAGLYNQQFKVALEEERSSPMPAA